MELLWITIKSMRSIAATIKGFKEFRSDSHIVGAILNNVNPMSYLFYKDVIERETGVKASES